MSTPCTAFVSIAHYLHGDDTPIVLLARVEFVHDAGDPRSAAIDRLREAHAAREAWVGALLHYDLKDHELSLAEVSDVLVGHGLATLP
jgi:hypothetical protein